MKKIQFPSLIKKIIEIENRTYIQCETPIYEIRKNKKGKLYKFNVSTNWILLQKFEEDM